MFLLGAEIAWENLGGGVKRKIMAYDDNIMMVNVHFETGAEGVMHKHHHTQVTYVVDGEFEFTVGNKTKTVKAGDSLYIPSNIMHGTVCKSSGVLIDVFSPIREDFME